MTKATARRTKLAETKSREKIKENTRKKDR